MTTLRSKGKLLLGTTLTASVLLTGCGSDTDLLPGATAPPPRAVNDSFDALGNAVLFQATSGVLANDAVNGAAISRFDPVGTHGGTIALNPDGSFTYSPVFGFVGVETFTYTLTNLTGSSKATVSLVSSASGFFVDNTAAAGGNGSQTLPFNQLSDAIGAANAGDTIFVSEGDGTSAGLAGAINLPAGVDLIGEGTGLVLSQTIVPQGDAPLLTGPITCGGSNTVSGLRIEGSASEGVIVNGVGDVTLSNNTIGNPALEHISCEDITGTVTIDGNTLENPPNTSEDWIFIVNNDSNGAAIITDNIFTNEPGNDVASCMVIGTEGSSVMDVTVTGNRAEGTVADAFGTCVYIAATDTSQQTVTVSDNSFSNLDGTGIGLLSEAAATLDGTVSGNSVSSASVAGVILNLAGSGGLITVNENIIDSAREGLAVNNILSDGHTYVLANNRVTNSVDNAIRVVTTGDSKVAVRDNTLTDSGISSLDVGVGNANLCLEVTGNSVNDDMLFTTTDAGATIELENGEAGLETVNTFAPGTVPVFFNLGTLTNRPPGYCNIP